MPSASGVLYVVATPIGNLEDLSFRALRILKEVDLIAAEDTRRTAKLLAHYEIRKPLISIREHNEWREAKNVVARIARGESIALVSDAGTPGIADPGARLVRAARAEGLKVVPIPGPNAAAAALSVSGLDASEFVFMGFPPTAGANRRLWLEQLAKERRTVVFFEAPHRIERTLSEVELCAGNRPILVNREISKYNEELVYWPISVGTVRTEGEFTVVVGATTEEPAFETAPQVADLVGRLSNDGRFTDDEIVSIVAAAEKIPPHSAKNRLKKHKFLVKNQSR
jgi:16S rRNA (cytidine1402-2'-O)-methyltransferase